MQETLHPTIEYLPAKPPFIATVLTTLGWLFAAAGCLMGTYVATTGAPLSIALTTVLTIFTSAVIFLAIGKGLCYLRTSAHASEFLARQLSKEFIQRSSFETPSEPRE